jgi:hypothetical protein
MNKMVVWVCGAILGTSIASSGCLGEDEACSKVTGEFMAVHTAVEGTCQLLQPTRYSFENPKTIATVYETDMGGTLVTDVNRMGCTMAVTKTRLDNENQTRWQMIGNLDVDNSKKITGVMTRYEWSADGQIVCQGLYDTTMNKIEPLVTDDTI